MVTPFSAISISAFSQSKAKPVLRAIVPMGMATRSSSGYRSATSCVIRAPSDKPMRTTGGLQTWRISSAQSAAKSAIGHGGSVFGTVVPAPRGSNEVQLKRGAAIAIAKSLKLFMVHIAGLVARRHPDNVRAVAVLNEVDGRTVGIDCSFVRMRCSRSNRKPPPASPATGFDHLPSGRTLR
jgi:hypothetical protein